MRQEVKGEGKLNGGSSIGSRSRGTRTQGLTERCGAPIQPDDLLLTVCRYVERNALRANLVKRAEEWRYNSLWRRQQDDAKLLAILAEWPVQRPRSWLQDVNRPQGRREVEALRRSVIKGCPYGSPEWQARIAARIGLGHTLRSRGRPRRRQK